MKKILYINLITILALLWSCSTTPERQVPEKLGGETRTRIITGADATKLINELHGLDVAATNNIIAYYGAEEEDILYVTTYASEDEASQDFKAMIDKMSADEESPFYHLMPLSSYENKVYMTIGMGAIHYIYISGSNLLWLQTMQSFGMELPDVLLALYPVGTKAAQQ